LNAKLPLKLLENVLKFRNHWISRNTIALSTLQVCDQLCDRYSNNSARRKYDHITSNYLDSLL